MHHKFVRALAGLGLCLALTACVDNDYDLSDVDTLVKIPVNNLTIPVNIEPIELDNIFNIDYNDPDNVVHVVNGEYAVEKGGSFDSGDISVAPISFTSPTIAPSKTVIDTGIGDLPAGMMPPALEFGLATGERTFSFSSGNVSRYIRDVDAVKCDMSLMLDIIYPELDGLVKAMTVSDLSLQLPRGLENVSVDGMSGAKYNKSTGVLTVPAFTATRANTMLSVRAGGVDIDFMEKAGEAEFKPSADNTDDGRFRIDGEFYILSGQCTVKASDLTVTDPSRLPATVTLNVSYTLGTTTVNSFTGVISYDISDVNIPDVSLSGLPDILSQEGTDVALQNPQVYLKIVNPLAAYGLGARTSLRVIAHRNGQPDRSFTADADIVLDGTSATAAFVLSPADPSAPIKGYEGAKWVKFSTLGDVLAGEGLPASLSFELVDPRVPEQKVTDFVLGKDNGAVHGDYDITAPLGLKADSRIVYAHTVDGWNTDDVDHITIEKLLVETTVSTNIPVALTLTGYPVDTKGNRINDAQGRPITITSASVPANAKDCVVKVETQGVIPAGSGLDGIHYVATAVAGADGKPLSPDMTITLTGIRATASGFYLKDL